jgi:hypothetical protein
MGVKKNSTYSIDEDVKKSFKMECAYHDIEQSETLESFMVSFTKSSRDGRTKTIENGEKENQ